MTSFYTVCPKCKAVVYVKCGIIKCPCGYKQKIRGVTPEKCQIIGGE